MINGFCSGTMVLAVTNNAVSYASAAEDITNFINWATVSNGPLKRGMGSSSLSIICAPTRLRALGAFKNNASACAQSTMLLARYVMPLSGYVTQ